MVELPRFTDWEPASGPLLPGQIRDAYERLQYRGVIEDPEQAERLSACLEYKTWADAADEYGTAGTGRGRLSAPWLCASKHEPDIWPGPAQTRGDCVSRSTASAATVSMFVEIETGAPDEVSGLVEHYEPVEYPSEGVLASEVIYAARGHRGEGANCDRLALWVSVSGGLLLRKRYDFPEYGELDLRRYNGDLGYRMGPEPPAEITEEAGAHRVRTVTRVNTIEEAADALANGYGISCCSNYGFISRRDRFGVSRRQGHWMHAMAWIGCNDDPEDKATPHHGRPLFLVLNSWGESWNSGPQYNGQPAGSFWITAKVAQGMLERGGAFAFSSVDGFPRRDLPDFGATGLI